MQVSRFNIITKIPNKEVWLIYNTFKGTLDAIKGKKYYLLVKNVFENIEKISLEKSKENQEFLKKNKEFFNNFIAKGYIVKSKEEELKDLFYLRNTNKYNCEHDHFEIYIAPTLNCNFHCKYCFVKQEYNERLNLSREIENQIVSYLERKCKDKVHIKINWYGGEPTLRLEQIERMLNKINGVLKDKTIDNMIFTNGFNLNKTNIEKLNKLAIKYIVLTFHTDYVLNNKSIYNTILSNVKSLNSRYNGKVTFRIMVSGENYNNILPIITDFTNRGAFFENNPKINIEFKPIVDENGRFISNSGAGKYSFKQYAKMESFLESELVKRNLINNYNIARNATFCSMHDKNTIGITVNGNFFRCSEEVGDLNNSLYGSLKDKKDIEIKNSTYRDILLWEVPNSCLRCKVLPMCFGGCIKHTIRGYLNCRPERYNIKKKMQIRYEFIQNQRTQNI